MRRKTHEEFIAEMKVVNPSIEAIGEYKTSRVKVRCRCVKDGYTWDANPFDLLMGSGCPKCSGNAKKTHKQFVEELRLINKDIEIIGNYINTSTKILCKCKSDNFEWEATPNSLLMGSGCPKCSGNIKNKTTVYFKDELKKINPNIELLGEYKGSKTKTLCKCLIDGFIFNMRPNALLSGQGCPKCNGKMRLTQKEYVDRLQDILPNIEVLGEYISQSKRISVRCKIDGYEWSPIAGQLVGGYGCPECAIRNNANARRKPQNEFISQLKAINPNVVIKGEYLNNHTKILFKCEKHNNLFIASPNNVLKGRGCKQCGAENTALAQTKTHNQFVNDLFKVNPEIIVLGKYENSLTRILVGSVVCNHKWETIPSNLLQGTSCPKCNASKGERKIRRYLKDNTIPFQEQHRFKGCKHRATLPFDFYIPTLNLAIEYDGRQHYEPVGAFGGVEEFKQIKIRDNVKTNYCKSKGIRLIRIPYTTEDINEFLDEQLNINELQLSIL